MEGAIEKLEHSVVEMTQMLRNQSVPHGNMVSQPNPSPPATTHYNVSPVYEPKLPPPEMFNGESKQCRPFLTQCEMHFQLQPSSFPSERAMVCYGISLLAGKAKMWGTAQWQRDSNCCYVFKEFASELIRVFDPVLPDREAARRLFSIKQGNKRVIDYIIEFHTIAADSHWNDPALIDAFFNGLSDKIKDELTTRERPDDLQGLEELATRIDLRLLERRQERQGRTEPSPPWKFRSNSPTQSVPKEVQSTEEPMQLGCVRVSPEVRQRRSQGNLCFYCGGKGHVVRQCPLKSQTQQGPGESF